LRILNAREAFENRNENESGALSVEDVFGVEDNPDDRRIDLIETVDWQFHHCPESACTPFAVSRLAQPVLI
jgi:hypothetical protein